MTEKESQTLVFPSVLPSYRTCRHSRSLALKQHSEVSFLQAKENTGEEKDYQGKIWEGVGAAASSWRSDGTCQPAGWGEGRGPAVWVTAFAPFRPSSVLAQYVGLVCVGIYFGITISLAIGLRMPCETISPAQNSATTCHSWMRLHNMLSNLHHFLCESHTILFKEFHWYLQTFMVSANCCEQPSFLLTCKPCRCCPWVRSHCCVTVVSSALHLFFFAR